VAAAQLERDFIGGLAVGTRATYGTGERAWMRNCSYLGMPRIMRGRTAEDELRFEYQVMMFAEMMARTVKAGTIGVYIAGVRALHIHVVGYVPWGGDRALRLARVLAGIRRRQAKAVRVVKREPVTLAILEEWRSRMDLSLATDRMLWAALVLAFFGLLRKSEFTAPSATTFDPETHLARRDVAFQWRGKKLASMTVHIKYSKTEAFGAGYAIPVAASGGRLCPVRAVFDMIQADKGRPDAPLFRLPGGAPLTGKGLALALAQLVAGTPSLEAVRMTPHSLRIGGAVRLSEIGASELVLQLAGRWRSDAYKAYLRFSPKTVLTWSRRMAARAGSWRASDVEHEEE
jgi:hypothetical protein